jgi:hypothetical protein
VLWLAPATQLTDYSRETMIKDFLKIAGTTMGGISYETIEGMDIADYKILATEMNRKDQQGEGDGNG